MDRAGSVVVLGEFPGSERYFEGRTDFPRPFGKLTSAVVANNAIYVGTGDSLVILKFSLAGKRDGAISPIGGPSTEVTAQDINRYIEQQVARRRLALAEATRAGLKAVRYPSVFPAFANLLVDALNHLWVEDFPLPGKPRRWTVYSEAGTPLGALTVDARFQIHDAGNDYVVGVWSDEDEVEQVRVYSIAR